MHNGPGESLSDVYDRVQQAIDQAVPLMESGHSVLFVAHAHVLRILTARWLGSTAFRASAASGYRSLFDSVRIQGGPCHRALELLTSMYVGKKPSAASTPKATSL